MFLVWAQFEISTGRITDAGSTVFSHCPNPADADRAFADYAKDLGYTEEARHDAHINRSWDAGLVYVAACTTSEDALHRAACIRAAAVAVFTVRTVELGCRDLPLPDAVDDSTFGTDDCCCFDMREGD